MNSKIGDTVGGRNEFWNRRWLMRKTGRSPSCSSFATASTDTTALSSTMKGKNASKANANAHEYASTAASSPTDRTKRTVALSSAQGPAEEDDMTSVASSTISMKSSSSSKNNQNRFGFWKRLNIMNSPLDMVLERSISSIGTTFNMNTTAKQSTTGTSTSSTSTRDIMTMIDVVDKDSTLDNNTREDEDEFQQVQIASPNQVRVKIITSHEVFNPAVLYAQEEAAAAALESSCVVYDGSDSDGDEDDSDNLWGGQKRKDEDLNPSTGMFDFCGIVLDTYHSSSSRNKNGHDRSSSSSSYSSLRRRRDHSNPTMFHVGDVVIGTTRVPLHHDCTTNDDEMDDPDSDVDVLPLENVTVNVQNIIKISHQTTSFFHQVPHPTTYCTVLEGFRQAGILQRVAANNNSGREWYDLDYDEMSIAIIMNEEMQLQKEQNELQVRSKRGGGVTRSTTNDTISTSVAAIELAQKLGIHRIVAVCGSDLDVQVAKQYNVSEIVHIMKRKDLLLLKNKNQKNDKNMSHHVDSTARESYKKAQEEQDGGGQPQQQRQEVEDDDESSFCPPKFVTFYEDTPGSRITTTKQGRFIIGARCTPHHHDASTTTTTTTPPEDITSSSSSTQTMTMKDWLEMNQGVFDFIYKEEVGRSLWSTGTTSRQCITLKPKQCQQLLKPENELLFHGGSNGNKNGLAASTMTSTDSKDDNGDDEIASTTSSNKNDDDHHGDDDDDDATDMRSALIQGTWSKHEATAKIVCYHLGTSSSHNQHKRNNRRRRRYYRGRGGGGNSTTDDGAGLGYYSCHSTATSTTASGDGTKMDGLDQFMIIDQQGRQEGRRRRRHDDDRIDDTINNEIEYYCNDDNDDMMMMLSNTNTENLLELAKLQLI